MDSGVRSEHAKLTSACHRKADQTAVLVTSAFQNWSTVGVWAPTSWESSGRTQTGQHPTQNIQQSHLSPHPALPCWPGNPLLRRPVLTPGPAAVPGEGRRMQLPSGSQGPGETEPVLKRQGGWLLCLGSLPGMTGPGSMVPLGLGFSHPRPGDRS